MSHRDSFIAALDANPSDQVTRSIFADWLEENGDGASDLILANGLRWMAANDKWPISAYKDQWDWFSAGSEHYTITEDYGITKSQGRWWKTHHPSAHAAEVALAESLWEAGITK